MWLPKKSIWIENNLHAKQFHVNENEAMVKWLAVNDIVFNQNHEMVRVDVMGGGSAHVPGETFVSVWDGDQFVVLENGDWVWTIDGATFVWSNTLFRAFFENTAEEATEEEG